MAESLGEFHDTPYMDDLTIGEIAHDAYDGGNIDPSGSAPYMDDFALGQVNTNNMNTQVDANRMLIWGGVIIAAMVFLGGRK